MRDFLHILQSLMGRLGCAKSDITRKKCGMRLIAIWIFLIENKPIQTG